MALTSWKAFKFFESSEVRFSDGEVAAVFSQNEFSSLCTGSDNLFLAGKDGIVRVLSKAFKIIRSFKAHDTGTVTHMKQIEGTTLLVTVAEDLSSEPVLKVWALDKIDKKTNIPKCQSTVVIQNGRKQFPISAFAALDDLSQVACGFANGAVTLIRGDLIHDRGARQRTVFESEEPITGIEFRQGSTTALYIATTARILVLIVAGRGQGQPARTLDDTGCAVGCMTIDQDTRDIIVARDDAIYYYGLHGRGSIYNCDGTKKMLRAHKDYVAIGFPASSSSIPLAKLGSAGSDASTGQSRRQALTILNTDFHFIAHTDLLEAELQSCFVEWGDLFVLTVDGKLHRFHEKPLQQKFQILFQRDYYVLAIQIAQKLGVSATQQNTIFRRYGDFLYQKKDYDTAMQQYLRAIDSTEPSQVIRKYLDTQRIGNLIEYLEELHEHGKATADHTTLLINCYAKLKDIEKLENFIRTPDQKFDLDTAISMCRQGGYYDQAAYLARKHLEHDVVVSVLVEDSKKYAEALAYIWRLEPELAFRNISRYAVVLLEHCPEDTTKLLIDYYTGSFRPKKDAIVVTTTASNPTQTNAAGLASQATSAVQSLAALLPLPYMSMGSTETKKAPDQRVETRIVETTDEGPAPKYTIPKPRSAFSAFVDHPHLLVTFLEACLKSDEISQEDKVDLYTTLFEIYLRTANENKGDQDKAALIARAKQLIESEDIPIDTSNVLLLSHLEKFRDGTVLVREQQGLRFDIFRSYTTARDTPGAIKALRKYGPEEPQLYPAALAYFTSTPEILQEAGPELEAVLRKIQDDKLMAPLQVIQTLSTNDVATIGLVKTYLRDTVSKERKEIDENRNMIQAFRTDTTNKRTELAALSSEPAKFTNTRCSACGYGLDQPTVHFLCQHSFHQRCLNIAEGESIEDVECPQCAPKNATIRAMKRAQSSNKDRHDMFLEALARSKDGFGTVADWFGRGVMGASTTDA